MSINGAVVFDTEVSEFDTNDGHVEIVAYQDYRLQISIEANDEGVISANLVDMDKKDEILLEVTQNSEIAYSVFTKKLFSLDLSVGVREVLVSVNGLEVAKYSCGRLLKPDFEIYGRKFDLVVTTSIDGGVVSAQIRESKERKKINIMDVSRESAESFRPVVKTATLRKDAFGM